MGKVGDMELYSLDELKDMTMGHVGTPERDEYEHEVEEALRVYHEKETQKKKPLMKVRDVLKKATSVAAVL